MTQTPPSSSKDKSGFQGAKSKVEKDRLASALRKNLLRRKSLAATDKKS